MSLLVLTIDQQFMTVEQIARINGSLPAGISFVQSGDVDTIKELAKDIEIIAGWFDPAWLADMPRLRWVQMWSAGVDRLLDFPELKDAPFTITNAAGAHAVQISEHVFALILALGRNIPNAVTAQKKGVWARVKHRTEPLDTPFAFSSGNLFQLVDKTMLILGPGGIGERVAKIAKAFDMQVIGYRRSPEKTSPYVDRMVGSDGLQEVLALADIIVNILPLTEATKHLLGAPEFAVMKPSAYVINVGRGGTIDEKALIEALENGTIAAAGLDVYEKEPLPDDSPLWTLPNVIMTSHYSGAVPDYNARVLDIFLDNLERYQDGRSLRNVVDMQLGY